MRYPYLCVAVLSALVIGGATAGAQGIGSPNMDPRPGVNIPPPVRPAPPPVEAAPLPVQANRIHRNAAGDWEPDAGCHWLNDKAGDFRVRCDDD